MRRTVVYPDAATLATAAAARVIQELTDVLTVRAEAHLVVTGGTVGIATLEQINASPLRDTVDWTSVHVWWGDERFVPEGHADRNEGQATAALLGSLPLRDAHVHRMGSSDAYATAEHAAEAMLTELAQYGTSGHAAPAFDVLLLGLGPDAHVASLFPGHEGLAERTALALAVHDSPKPPPTRVSLGLAAINHARKVWVVAAGEGKAEAVRDCLAPTSAMPGGLVHGAEETLWLVDVEAASLCAPADR